MRRSTRSLASSARSLMSLGLVLQLGLGAPLASAAETSAADKAASRKVFLAAQADYAAGRYAQALTGYTEAHRLFPMPAFIFNIAQCHRLLKDPQQALAQYRRYLAEEPAAKNRATVEGFISELESEVAALAPKEQPKLVPSQASSTEGQAVAAIHSTPAASAAPLHQQWWFWTGVAVVVGGVAVGVAAANSGPQLPGTTLGDVDLR